MDQIVQSLVQSPYVRTMSSLPTKSEELVHGVDNFLPPLSRRKVMISPSSGRTSRDVYRFDIPRLEHLDGLELVLRARDYSAANINVVNINSGAALNLEAEITNERVAVLNDKDIGVNQIESIVLHSKNRVIEELHPHAISHELMVQSEYDGYEDFIYNFGYSTFQIDAMRGSVGATRLAFPAKSRRLSTSKSAPDLTFTELRGAQWHIPLPFCSLSMIKKNFQTSFLETLSVNVKTRYCPFFQSVPSGYDMVLVASYHQYHPSVESVIRNANYKANIPATLPWWEWVPIGNLVQSTSTLRMMELQSDALISELLIVPQLYDSVTGLSSYAWHKVCNFLVRLTSNGEVLVESDAESLMEDQQKVLVAGSYGASRAMMRHGPVPIRFGLRYGEMFTGGISLASLNNVMLSITPPAGASFTTSVSGVSYEINFLILAKRHYMLRIDSDTGVVSRSIES